MLESETLEFSVGSGEGLGTISNPSWRLLAHLIPASWSSLGAPIEYFLSPQVSPLPPLGRRGLREASVSLSNSPSRHVAVIGLTMKELNVTTEKQLCLPAA